LSKCRNTAVGADTCDAAIEAGGWLAYCRGKGIEKKGKIDILFDISYQVTHTSSWLWENA